MHMGALIWNVVATRRIVSDATEGLSSGTYDGQESLAAFENAVYAQSWMITLTLAANVCIKNILRLRKYSDSA